MNINDPSPNGVDPIAERNVERLLTHATSRRCRTRPSSPR